MARLSEAVRQAFVEDIRILRAALAERDARIEALQAQVIRARAQLDIIRSVVKEEE
jgi:hypothetical protein